MSGMILGGMLEGDRRVRGYEESMRLRKRIERDTSTWRQWEDLVERSTDTNTDGSVVKKGGNGGKGGGG